MSPLLAVISAGGGDARAGTTRGLVLLGFALVRPVAARAGSSLQVAGMRSHGGAAATARPAASLAGAWRSTLDDMLSLALVNLLVVADVPPTDAAVYRGTGWYSAGTTVPEPPIALALVIVAAAGMRVRERRRSAAASSTSSTDQP